jgi:hypothetical protein
VTFSNPPGHGTLSLTGDVLAGGGALSVPVATAGAGPTYMFTGIRLKSDNTASSVTATFSANTCTAYTNGAGPTVPSCVTPALSYTESCKCFDVAYDLPEFDPLEYTDSIKVNSNPGENWRFVIHSGLEVPDTLVNIPLPQDTALTEFMPGMYGIRFSHTSGVGYTGRITNGIDTLDITNYCTNPSLTIPNLASGVMCPTSAPFPFNSATATLDGMNEPGTFTFNIVRAPGDTLFNVTELNPALMSNNSTVEVIGRYVPTNAAYCPHTFVYYIDISSAACPCGITVNAVTPTTCNPTAGGTYNLTVNVTYTYPPAGESIVIMTSGGATGTFSPTHPNGGSESFVLTGLPSTGIANNAVTAHFATTTACTHTLANAYNSPVNCATGPCTGGTGTLGGTAFNDVNFNGANNGEAGLAGIGVKIYDCDGNLVGNTTTDANGDWQSGGLTNGSKYRVEFVIPATLAYLEESTFGTGNATNTQFVTPINCDVDFAVINPDDYCQANPLLSVPCYFSGPQNNALPALVGLYNNAPESTTPLEYGLVNDVSIGTTYGLAYQRKTKKLFASAMTRHYFDYGPGGFDAIYAVNVNDVNDDLAPTPTATLGTTIDLSNLGVNMGLSPRSTALTGNAPYNDGTVYQKVGKAGIGDIDISTDGDTLFAINLNSAAPSLVVLNVSKPSAVTLISEIPLPTGMCTGGAFAPWAVKSYKGKTYIGGVCNAETSLNLANLDALVYRWDGGTNFTQVATMDMNYPRGAATYRSDDTYASANWRAWTNTWAPGTLVLSGGDLVSQPQPILQDLEFLEDGSLVLGFGDRFAYQTAFGNRAYNVTTGSVYYSTVAAGDIIKFCNVGGTFIKEATTGACAQLIDDLGSTNIPAIPDLKEYFDDNYINATNTQAGHSEVALGGLAVVPGKTNFLAVVFDPIKNQGPVNTSGIRTINSNGTYNKGWVVVTQADGDNNRKGGSLGDIEALCNPIPIEVGNYVWYDADQDGVQDPCEMPLDSVVVSIYKADGTLVGKDTTDALGRYIFNNLNVDTIAPYGTGGFTGLTPNTPYFIVFGKETSNLGGFAAGILTIGTAKMQPTVSNTGEGTSTDLNDSDPVILSGAPAALNGFPGIAINTPDYGADHTFDFGLRCIAPDLSVSPAQVTVCSPVSVNLATAFTLTDANNTTAATGYPKYYASAIDAANNTNPLASTTVTVADTFWIRKNTLDGCWDTVHVIVNAVTPPNAGSDGSSSVCDNDLTSINLFSVITGEQAGGTWTRTTGTGGTFNAAAGTFTPAGGATSATFTYTVTGTSPCADDASVATINITPAANAGSDGSSSVCDNDANSINLFSVITGEQAGGTWTRTTGTGGTFNAGAGTFTPGAGVTNSTFTYTVTGTSPCADVASVASISITPSANAGSDGSSSVCDNDANSINLFSVITGEQVGGTWTRTTGTGGTFNAAAGTFTPAAGVTSSTFTYTVTRAAPCADDFSIAAVDINPAPTPSLTGATICAGSTSTLDAGSYSSYEWSSGEISEEITKTAGVYTVTVTDISGCTGSASATISNYTAPTPTLANATVCPGGTSVLDAGSYTSYAWSSTETTQTVTKGAGTYTVTVTDANGCTGSASATISNYTAPTPTLANATVCPGGTSVLDAGSYTSYAWSSTETTQTVTKGAGTYTVTVTDANGCTGSTSATISNYTTPTPTLANATVCPSGTSVLDAGSYTSYAWSSTETTQTVTKPAGTYTVTVTDANGCTGSTSAIISTSTGLSPTLANATVCPGGTSVLDAGNYNSYSWSSGETSRNVTKGAGTFTVTVSDASGCTGSVSATISEHTAPAPILANATVCQDATSILDAGSYASYVWSSGENTQTVTKPAGTYTVIVTDANGCTGSASATITSVASVNAGSDGNTTVCENAAASINLFSLITAEQSGGTWTRTSGIGGTFDAILGEFVPAAGATSSTFTYTVAGVPPCLDDASTATVNITPAPSMVNITQTVATCTSAAANNNGVISLASGTEGTHFGISTVGATTYNGPLFNGATIISLPQVVQSNIPNAGGAYILRIFNNSDDCYVDKTVVVVPVACTAPCPFPNCGTATLIKN